MPVLVRINLSFSLPFSALCLCKGGGGSVVVSADLEKAVRTANQAHEQLQLASAQVQTTLDNVDRSARQARRQVQEQVNTQRAIWTGIANNGRTILNHYASRIA